jgi:hypothetical protein
MRVTIQQRTDPIGRRPRYEGTRENVYELKVEVEGGYSSPYGERIEIEYHGAFYRIEPVGDRLELSAVGLPGVRLSLHPQEVNKVAIRSGREEG